MNYSSITEEINYQSSTKKEIENVNLEEKNLSPTANVFIPQTSSSPIQQYAPTTTIDFSTSQKDVVMGIHEKYKTHTYTEAYLPQEMYYRDLEIGPEIAIKKNENYFLSSTSYQAIFQGTLTNLLYIFRIYGKPSCQGLMKNIENNLVYRMHLEATDQLELFPIILVNMLQHPEIHIKRFFIPQGHDEIELYFEFESESSFRKANQMLIGKTPYFCFHKVSSSRGLSPELVIGMKKLNFHSSFSNNHLSSSSSSSKFPLPAKNDISIISDTFSSLKTTNQDYDEEKKSRKKSKKIINKHSVTFSDNVQEIVH